MKTVLRYCAAVLVLAALHWVLLYAMSGLSMLGRMGTMHADGSTPQMAAERAAMKPYSDAFDRAFDFTFLLFSWPGRIVHPIKSVVTEPEEYDATKPASIATSLFWGCVFPCAFLLTTRLARRHATQPNVA